MVGEKDVVSQGKVRTDVVSQGKVRTDAVSQGKVRTDVVSQGKVRTDVVSQGKVRTDVVSQGKVRTDVVSQGKVRTDVVSQGKVRTDVVSQGKVRKVRMFLGDSTIRKLDKVVNRGEDIMVCLPGAKIEDVAEKAGQVMGGGTEGAVLVYAGTNNAEKEGTSAITGNYRRLVRSLKEARTAEIVLSGILPVM